MQGQYLPRIYLSHLLSDDVIRKINNRSLRPSDLGYLIQRQNIPKAIRELMLKEIKDPAFLAGKALSIPARDIQLIRLFDQIADNPEIAFQETVTEFDYLREIENIVGDQDRAKEILKELELDPSVEERRQQLQTLLIILKRNLQILNVMKERSGSSKKRSRDMKQNSTQLSLEKYPGST